MRPHRQRPVSLEDLLRLKRSERPAAEFWQDFDRQLRAKQLAALVEKRPWWQALPRPSWSLLGRLRLPLGAASLLALTFVTLRDDPRIAEPAAIVPAAPEGAVVGLPGGGSLGPATMPPATVSELEEASTTVKELKASAELVAAAAEGSDTTTTAPTSTSSAGLTSFLPGSTLAQSLPAAPSNRLLGTHSGFEARALPARPPVEPLQQMSAPGESRRSRLLTAMVSSTALEASPRTTARAASRIAEEQLYDQVQRFGARGDRLHVKF
jgi:hypothetical protein